MRRALILGLLFYAACTTLPDPAEERNRCERICDRNDECPGLEGGEECVDRCVAQHLPEGCADAWEEASCTELAEGISSQNASWVNACYPKCSPDGVECQGARLLVCSNGRFVGHDCTYLCEQQGEEFSGVCAKTRNGQSTTSGLPECWCDPK